MLDRHDNPACTAVIIPFPRPFRAPKILKERNARQEREKAIKTAQERTKRHRYAQKILAGFPGVMTSAFDDFRAASLAAWWSDLEHADDEEFLLSESFLARFRKVEAFAHMSSYSLKHLCEDWHRFTGREEVYVSNGVLIVAAISLGFRGKCIAGTPNAIFNLSRADLKQISKQCAEYRAGACIQNLRGRSK